MSDVVARAREALQGITPGPWKSLYHYQDTSYPSDTYQVITARTGDRVAEVDDQSRYYDEPHGEFGRDAEFIAGAPALVADLVDALEQARAELEHLRALQRDDRTAR